MTLFLVYLATGALAGLLGGLLGVGGGLIVVPVLVFLFQAQHFPATVLTQMAVATSLATIIFTSISAIRAHHERGAVRWELVRRIAPGIVLGTLLGAEIAHGLEGRVLQLIIGSFALLVGLQMLTGWQPGRRRKNAGENLPGPAGLATGGGVIGMASALFGIGGGSMTVPWLSHAGLRMQEAVATSSACGLAIALSGAAGFIFTGLRATGLPEHSLGYVYLPAFLGISLASLLFARLGATLAHRLPAATLKRIFALLLLLIGSQFIFGLH
ncbi:MAG TPA: sulfite exporter TauE/SafE family protein [Moraxellaceae bacterium]